MNRDIHLPEEIKEICLIKAYAWNLNIKLRCRDCIYNKDSRCMYEHKRG